MKTYREWIQTPLPVLLDRPGFLHAEMAAQACISIQSMMPTRPTIVQDKDRYRIALEAPSEFDLQRAAVMVDSLLEVDARV